MRSVSFVKDRPKVERGSGDTFLIDFESGSEIISLALTRHAALYLQALLLDELDGFEKTVVKQLRQDRK